MGMTVAAEKALQPEHVAVLGTADDHWPARLRLQESDPAQDQGAHDPLAEFSFRDQQGAQPVGRNGQRLDWS